MPEFDIEGHEVAPARPANVQIDGSTVIVEDCFEPDLQWCKAHPNERSSSWKMVSVNSALGRPPASKYLYLGRWVSRRLRPLRVEVTFKVFLPQPIDQL